MKKILLTAAVLFGSAVFAPSIWAKITIFLCGDSTMQDWNEGYYPKRGIGQEFSYFWNQDVVNVVNKGAGGTYAKGYYTKQWPSVLEQISAGDFVLIGFGINDRTYSNEADYVTATTAMANEAKAKGATPIIMNPVRRSDFRYSSSELSAPDSIYESYHGYPIRAREIAESLGVPLIDMDTLSRNYLLSVGQYYALHYVNMVLDSGEYSTYAKGNSDNLHLQQNGAIVFGRILTEQMRIHSDEKVRVLAQNLAPMYSLKVSVSPEGSDSMTTVSSYYPEGMTVTLKTTPKAGKRFLGWYDGEGNRVGNSQASVLSENICTFTMKNASTAYTAVYEGGSPEIFSGDASALSAFPQGTPKTLEGVSPGSAETIDTTKVLDKNIAKWFDAVSPDSFDVGWSENSNAGFSGDGYWNFDNALNTFAEYRMRFESAGNATLAIAYANGGSSARKLNVYLDHDYLVEFPSTGSWTTWDTAYVSVDLPIGEESLKFISASADGGPNIDAFGFNVPGVERAGKTSPDTATTAIGENLNANFSNAEFKLEGSRLFTPKSGTVTIKVFDLSGKMLGQKNLSVGAGSSELALESLGLSSGIYRIVARMESYSAGTFWLNHPAK